MSGEEDFETLLAQWAEEERQEYLRQEALDQDSPRIGYVCRKGHFVFSGDPDDSCGSKVTGWIRVHWRSDEGEWPEGVLAESLEGLQADLYGRS